MIVRGSDGQIAKILLKDYAKLNDKKLFQKGNFDEFEIEYENIGNVKTIFPIKFFFSNSFYL
jgi:hypothetical protein